MLFGFEDITGGPLLDSFAKMIQDTLPDNAVKVVRIDSSSQFLRDVTVITIEIPNEVINQFHIQ